MSTPDQGPRYTIPDPVIFKKLSDIDPQSGRRIADLAFEIQNSTFERERCRFSGPGKQTASSCPWFSWQHWRHLLLSPVFSRAATQAPTSSHKRIIRSKHGIAYDFMQVGLHMQAAVRQYMRERQITPVSLGFSEQEFEELLTRRKSSLVPAEVAAARASDGRACLVQ